MLREMIEYSHKIKEEVKVIQRRKIYRGPRVKGRKPRFKSKIWNIRKKAAFNQNSKRKQEFKKNEGSIKTFWDISNRTNIQIMGCPGETRKNKKLNMYL